MFQYEVSIHSCFDLLGALPIKSVCLIVPETLRVGPPLALQIIDMGAGITESVYQDKVLFHNGRGRNRMRSSKVYLLLGLLQCACPDRVCVESRVLRGTFRPKREKLTGYRDLNNEELRNLYFSPNIIRAI
jgi:hypothetical protein